MLIRAEMPGERASVLTVFESGTEPLEGDVAVFDEAPRAELNIPPLYKISKHLLKTSCQHRNILFTFAKTRFDI